MSEDGSTAPRAPAKSGWRRHARNPWLWAGFGGLLFVTLGRGCTNYVPEPPPIIAPAPAFSLTTLAGDPITQKDLAGNPYIAHFVGGGCGAACDETLKAMTKLQKGFKEGWYGELPVHIVTFVVGDERVANHYRAWIKNDSVDPKKWTFVWGPETIVREMAVALGTLGERRVDPVWDLGLVLVDSEGRCRAYYGTEMWEIDRVFHQAKDLSRATP